MSGGGQWSIGRRCVACEGCEHEFEDGERHASSLVIRDGHLVREDLCDGCFSGAGDRETGERELFWWFTHYQAAPKKGLKLDLEALDRLFDALADHQAETARELRYLISLLLMRKRRLKLERVERGKEGEALLLRRPRRKDVTRVFVFDFDRERIDTLRSELRALFDGIESEDGVNLGSLVAQAD